VQDAFGQVVQTLMAAQQLPAGQQAADWDAAGVPDGRYRLVVTAGTAKAAADVVVDRTLTGLTTTAAAISPNADGIQDTLTLSFSLAASVPVRIDVQRDGAVVATLSDGTRGPGAQVLDWDGKDAAGMPLPDGSYRLVATVTDALGSVPIALPVTVDSTPPTLMLVDPTTLRFTLSEPATVTLLVNGATVLKTEPAGAFHVPAPKAGVSTVSAQARDAAGNVSQTVSG
jgi:flagellar hook assembly protein FlgD